MPILHVNGNEHACPALPPSLLALVESLGVKPQTVVAEVNGVIVPREVYAQTTLAEGDRVELVRFLGGG